MLELKVSVRNLVEFILRSGDIDTGYMRMNIACPRSVLEKAMEQLKEAVSLSYGI